MKTIFSVN
jgi:ribosomal protein S27E